MEAIAAVGGRTLETSKLPIPELVELGWLENEAQDYHNGKTTFPCVTVSHSIFGPIQGVTNGHVIGTISLKFLQK
jgi:hypothetical protein